MNIPVRTFAQATETSFLDESSVPLNLRDWWLETRDNLLRMHDRVQDLESGDNLSPATISLVKTSGSASALFDAESEATESGFEDFLAGIAEAGEE